MKKMTRQRAWREEWPKKSLEDKAECQKNGTTPWSRDWAHYRKWTGEMEPTYEDHIKFLTEGNSSNLDDFLATNAVVEYLDEIGWKVWKRPRKLG